MKKFDDFVKDLKKETQEELSENAVRWAALEKMREVQTQLSALSLIDVLSVMKPENPLRQQVIDMEAIIHDITNQMGEFINDNLADAEDIPGEGDVESPEEEEVEEPEEKKEEKPKKEEKKPAKKDKKDEEPSEPEVKGDAPKEQSQEEEDEK